MVTDNPGFYGFYGFFGFISFFRIIPDEMFVQNVNKAAKNAFFAGLFIYPVIIVAGAFTSIPEMFAFGFAANFAIQLLIFSISLAIYEKKGSVIYK
ncbi:MAG: hypothetical protein BWY15_01008 [Firmicutes bacterium ADurb.Bin193]|nr:MAG: hypothetical protein BWY15_01008 [Firmicutes bacterium ADurb.Bin193]